MTLNARRIGFGTIASLAMLPIAGCTDSEQPAASSQALEIKGNAGSDPTSQNISAARLLIRPQYPETKRLPVKETWHGTEVIDDYAWLQNKDEKAVERWTVEQNALTRTILGSLPDREAIKANLKKWFELGNMVCPERIDNNQFQWRRTKGENHAVLYVKDLQTGAEEVLLNPNIMSKDGTKAVDWTHISSDGKLIAYGVSDGGTEKSVLYIKNVETKQELSDIIPNTRACSLAWLPDNSGFYYTRYPEKGEVPEGEEQYHRTLYFHKLGTDYKKDPLVLKPSPFTLWPEVAISEDGKWVSVLVASTSSVNDAYIAELKEPYSQLELKPIFVGKDNRLLGQAFENYFYMQTDYMAPKSKIMRVSLDEKDLSDMSKWEEVVPEGNGTLGGFGIAGRKIFLSYQERAFSRLEIVDIDTREKQVVELPIIGSITGLTGRQNSLELLYAIESYTAPISIYTLNVNTLKQEKIDELKIAADLSNLETNQVTYKSKDGTEVTMFLVHKKDIEKNGQNKVFLTGYGGFNSSETPYFSKSFIHWIEQGGICAIPNLRGGGEYGEKWHRGGMLDQKQNVFDDFIGAAEFLIKEGYTKPKKLAIEGGSNGGLLVGAVLTQRPDLFGAVICDVPLLDMIHYPGLEVAKYWIGEYGDPAKPEDFQFLYEYSPYHRVKDGTAYPAVLLRTADGDSRVDAMHAKKMAARLQAATSSDKPVLLFVEEAAGHGAGKPLSKVIEETADMYAFLNWALE